MSEISISRRDLRYFSRSKFNFHRIAMIDNLNTDDDVVGVKQLVLAIVAIVAILSLWSFLTTVHI